MDIVLLCVITKSSILTFFILVSIISPSLITRISVSSCKQSPSNILNEHFHLSFPLASINLSTFILDNFLFKSLCNLLSSAIFFLSIQSNTDSIISDFKIDLINLSLTLNSNPNSFISVINFSFVCDEKDGFTTVEFINKNI